MKYFLMLFLSLSIAELSFAGNQEWETYPDHPISGGGCARLLNGLAMGVLQNEKGTPALVNLSWLGNANTPGTNGWVRLTGVSFKNLLDRAGYVAEDGQEIAQLMTNLRLTREVSETLDPDDLALGASVAAAQFLNLGRIGKEQGRNLYGAFTPPVLDWSYPEGVQVLYLFKPHNYGFSPETECSLIPNWESNEIRPINTIEGLVMRQPNFDDDESPVRFVSQLAGAIHRWEDSHLISRAIGMARGHGRRNLSSREHQAGSELINRIVGSDPEGQLSLSSPSIPLFVEIRAEAVQGYAERALLGQEFTQEDWEAAVLRAWNTVSKFTSPEAMAPYAVGDIFAEHIRPLSLAFRAFVPMGR
jgi:hypothetical protein